MEALVASASTALRNVENVEGFRDLALIGVKGLIGALELRHPAERGHAERVARGAITLGRAAGLDESELQELSVCAYLHDVGKVGIADAVLKKPGFETLFLHVDSAGIGVTMKKY